MEVKAFAITGAHRDGKYLFGRATGATVACSETAKNNVHLVVAIVGVLQLQVREKR